MEARAAHRSRRYNAAYASLRGAAEVAPLEVGDLSLLADSAWWLGLVIESLRATEEAHQRYLRSGDVDRAAAQALDLAGMLAMRGELALASGWLSRARRLLEGRPPCRTHGLMLYLELSEQLEDWRLHAASEAAQHLLRLAEELADGMLTSLALLGSGLVELRRGRPRQGFALLDEAMLPVVAGRVPPEWSGHVYCTIVSACLDLADLNRAREWAAAADRWLAGFSDAVMFDGVCRSHRALLLMAEGALAEAEEESRRVAAELQELNVQAVAEAEYQCGESFRLRQRLDDALACYERAATLGREPEPGRSLALLTRGDAAAAWSSVADAVSRSRPHPFSCAPLLRAQVSIGIAAGRTVDAGIAARALRELADDFGSPGLQAWADQAAGEVALAEGRAADAVEALEAAVSAHRRLHAWYDAAAAAQLLAAACRLTGDSARCKEYREEAEAAFRRFGVPVVPLPAASAGQRPSGDDSGLTPREVEVLLEVARGASNREVASGLSISEATVRRHLANIYLKLGVGSRTAAAAWAHQRGLAGREGRG
jgi:DNA-binding CsgD family transcriptional regulator